jgi:hypothetical protein
MRPVPEPIVSIMKPADRDRFAKCAAPQAIAVHLKRARAARARWDTHVRWLEALAAERGHQVDAGEWP